MTNELPRVFLDTDIGPDCDDTAALAILLQLCEEGHASLLGITHATGSPYGLAAIDAICRLFRVQIPLGTCADRTFLAGGSSLCYTPAIAAAFPHSYPPDMPQPDAADAFVRAVSPAPDQSVTLIAIGPLINVAHLLLEDATRELMHRKVRRIVLMAGRFDTSGLAEWNVEMDIPAARTLMARWAGELLFCPFEAASDVLTGACLRDDHGDPDTPVTIAYRLHTRGTMLRPSWDPATIACALLDVSHLFSQSAAGTISIAPDGVSCFTPCEGGMHRYLRRTCDASEAAAYLDALLLRANRTMARAIPI